MALPQQEQRNGLWDFFFGTPGGYQQRSNFNPEQISALDEMLSQGRQGLESGNVNLGPIEQQAQRQFQTQTVPSIAERFTSMGGGHQSRLGSGGFAGQLGAAGAGLNQDLASMRYQQLHRLLQGGLQPQFETDYRQSQPGFLENTLNNSIKAAGAAAGAYYGAPGMMGGGGGSGSPNPNYNFEPQYDFFNKSNQRLNPQGSNFERGFSQWPT